MVYLSNYQSPFGVISLISDENNLLALWFEGQKYSQSLYQAGSIQKGSSPVLTASKKWLDDYFANKKPSSASLPLAPIGGEFRKQVWKLLLQIPYGEVTTYGEIARQVAKIQGRESMSSQAVGGAVGHNPISIIIPCHRVVGSNGSLTGYAGGINLKIKLLELEGLDLSRFSIPKKGTAL